MQCIIIDDEPLAREGVAMNIKEVSFLQLQDSLSNAIQALAYLQDHQTDLIFLDIEMPGLSGLDFLRTLKSSPLVILTTAYPQYALEAFELDVIDYLVKPIRFERFYKAVTKAKEIYDLKGTPSYHIEPGKQDYIFIRSERKIIKIFFDEILYIKGLKDYVIIYTAEAKYITALNVKTIHSQLPASIFARVSKSYLINVNKIKSIDVDTLDLGGVEIPLGMSYKEKFLESYIKGSLLDRSYKKYSGTKSDSKRHV